MSIDFAFHGAKSLSKYTGVLPCKNNTAAAARAAAAAEKEGRTQEYVVDRQPVRIVETCGVTVSMSAFLACHQCYSAGLSLAWGLNLRALVCGIL